MAINYQINYQKIAECIADEIISIQEELEKVKNDKLIALEILQDNNLVDQYLKAWRKDHLRQNILIGDGDYGDNTTVSSLFE